MDGIVYLLNMAGETIKAQRAEIERLSLQGQALATELAALRAEETGR